MKEEEKLEKTFRDKLDDYKVPVAASAWAGIESALGHGASTVVTSVSTMFYAAAVVLSVAFTTAIISYNTEKTTQPKEDKKEVATVVPQEDSLEEKNQPTVDETTVESAIETAQTEAVKTPIAKATQQKYIVKEVSGNQTNNETVVKLEKVEENKLFASATASVSGGYAPLRVTFTHKSTENTKVHWNFGDKTESTLNSPTHTFIRPGKYVVTLTITDKKGNKTTDFKTIEVKEGSSITNISSVITPNGDGLMDEFTFVAKNIEEFELMVYNESGKKVFESNDINQKWKGSSSAGKKLSDGTYMYMINAKGSDGKEYQISGQVNILASYRKQ